MNNVILNLSNKSLNDCKIAIKEAGANNEDLETIIVSGINKVKFDYLVASLGRCLRGSYYEMKDYIDHNFTLLGSDNYKKLDFYKRMMKVTLVQE